MGHRLYVMRQDIGSSDYAFAQPFTMKMVDAGHYASESDAMIDDSRTGEYNTVHEFLQAMADAAWEIGIRPQQMEAHQNELKAVRYHLEDMRMLSGVKKL